MFFMDHIAVGVVRPYPGPRVCVRECLDISSPLHPSPAIVETDVTNKVYGIIKGIPVPFPLSEPDACKLGATCPMPANKMETEHVVIEILKLFPPVSRSY